MDRVPNQPFSAREYGEMLMAYGEARGNASLALRIYIQRYPNARHPVDSRVITRAYQRVLDNEPIVPQQEGSGRHVSARVEQRILETVQRNPRLGTRTAAKLLRRRGIRVSHWTVHKVLRRDRQRPYRLHKVQALVPGDENRRLAYCRWLANQQRYIPDFVSRIIWTDESTFTRNGMWNRRNSHIWARTNPREYQQTGHQTRWSVNVWAGIYHNKILGPFFLPERMNGPRYLEFLQQNLANTLRELENDLAREWDQMEEIPIARLPRIWFQHDGAPPHVVRAVREYLNDVFPQRWIGRFGPRAWPARSPDLTPLDFFLWGYIKEKVFLAECDTANEMRRRISDAFHKLNSDIAADPTMMPRLHAHTLYRAQLCEQLGGRHFEPNLIRRERR